MGEALSTGDQIEGEVAGSWWKEIQQGISGGLHPRARPPDTALCRRRPKNSRGEEGRRTLLSVIGVVADRGEGTVDDAGGRERRCDGAPRPHLDPPRGRIEGHGSVACERVEGGKEVRREVAG